MAPSRTCRMHQDMQARVHLRSIELFSRHVHNSFGCLFVLSCLVCMRACEVRLVGFPCRPSAIISLCSVFSNASWAFELFVQMGSSATSSSSASFVAVDSCLRWHWQARWLSRRAIESHSLVVGVRHSSRLKCACWLHSVPFIQAHSCDESLAHPLVRDARCCQWARCKSSNLYRIYERIRLNVGHKPA